MESNRCPPAVESELGTVQGDTITKIRAKIVRVIPGFRLDPLIVPYSPMGTSISGIQNQKAAAHISSITTHPGAMIYQYRHDIAPQLYDSLYEGNPTPLNRGPKWAECSR
jgi:hypothetical protein